jgi:hypothetical protein
MKRELERAGAKHITHNVRPDQVALFFNMQSSMPGEQAFVVAWNGQTVDNPGAVHPGDDSSQAGANGHTCRTMRN